MRLILIRHGITTWNERKLIQGRTDTPLSATGAARVRTWRLPHDWRRARWFSSPLRRARDTAALLEGDPAIDQRLSEMDWGRFEGRPLAALRAEDPAGMAANEARGLDFRPPGGESPREVVARLASFLADLHQDRPALALTHNGVVRAALVLATGWDLMGRPPLVLGRDQALVLEVGPDGAPALIGTAPLVAASPCTS